MTGPLGYTVYEFHDIPPDLHSERIVLPVYNAGHNEKIYTPFIATFSSYRDVIRHFQNVYMLLNIPEIV